MSAIDLNARASSTFAEKLAETQALLQQAALDYAPRNTGDAPRITLACSLGAEDMVLAHLVNRLKLDIGIFVLETGQLHAETLALLARLQATSRAPVQVFAPVREAVIQFVEREGTDAMYQSIALRKACCAIRKMEPLSRALADKDAWITGLRREQSGARAEVPLTDRSDAEKVKLNPLANWTWGDVWHYIAENKVDYNPLHDQFYPSIGCAPCTRAISLGEDFRAGRWWWEDEAAKECGLHVKASPISSTES
jgi:phosphoadenosine phosphosulfate reductase